MLTSCCINWLDAPGWRSLSCSSILCRTIIEADFVCVSLHETPRRSTCSKPIFECTGSSPPKIQA